MLIIAAAAIAGLFGIVVGAIIVMVAFNMKVKYDERKAVKNQELENIVKEIQTLNLLNMKINEILQKRALFNFDYVSFDSFDDCYITIDDFVYLQSFTSQNNYYLPTYLIEEFFKNISHRRVTLSPEETVSLGGYTYKGGRKIVETFSEDLLDIIEERKIRMKTLTSQPISYFNKKENYYR